MPGKAPSNPDGSGGSIVPDLPSQVPDGVQNLLNGIFGALGDAAGGIAGGLGDLVSGLAREIGGAVTGNSSTLIDAAGVLL